MDVVKEWEHAGFKCKMIEHSEFGHYCGYVWLPEDHPFAGRERGDIDDFVSVHGGITYTAWVEEGKEKFYVVGFDCAHAGDYVARSLHHSPGEHKWTLEEVVEETNRLAEQLTIPSLVERKLSR